jgi:hypothetical protein
MRNADTGGIGPDEVAQLWLLPTLQSPKSVTAMCPSLSSKMFSGFRSLEKRDYGTK